MKIKCFKIMIVLLMLSIIMATMPLNIVYAATEMNLAKIQISLEDGSKPNSTLAGDINCDGIVTGRDSHLTMCYEIYDDNELTKLTANGIENMNLYTEKNAIAIIPAMIYGISNGMYRVIGTNEFNIGDTVSLKAYSDISTGADNANDTCSQIGAGVFTGVTWESSDTNIAEVDSNGNVNFKNNGEVIITATTSDGLYYDYLKFYVGNATNGIELTGSSILKNSKDAKVNLKLDSSYFEKTMTGYKIKLIQRLSSQENEKLLGEATKIESKTAGWTVTEYQKNCDSASIIEYDFIVEVDDNYLDLNNNQNIPEILNIELTFPIDLNSNLGGNVFMVNEIQGTDYDNNVYVLSDLEDRPFLCMKRTESKISVKEGNEDIINIVGSDIYAKLDGITTNDSYSTAAQLYEKLDNLEQYDSYYIKDYAGNTIQANEKITTGYLILETDGQPVQYNLYVIGDICVDSSNCININDVVYLRKAIVGLYDTETPGDFCLNTTDANNSNTNEDGTRGLGDIGDVIEVRKRIINNKW